MGCEISYRNLYYNTRISSHKTIILFTVARGNVTPLSRS